MIIPIVIFLVALIFLVKGSDLFVKSAASIAKKLGVSEFIIGLTIVAIGTSIPELVSSVFASIEKASGLVIGNVVGSNIANIGLIIGTTSLVAVIITKEDMLKRDGFFMLFSALLFYLFAMNRVISRVEAGILLLFYSVYILFLFEMKNDITKKYHFREFIGYFFKFKYIVTIRSKFIRNKDKQVERLFMASLVKDGLLMVVGIISVIGGAKFVVDQSIFFASFFKVPQTVVGLSLIALGTSLPELSVSITAARKGFGALAVGNILGSNIANILLILGISGLIHPLSIIRSTISITAPFMILLSMLLLVFIRSKWHIKKVEGIVFVVLYAAFMVFLLAKGSVL